MADETAPPASAPSRRWRRLAATIATAVFLLGTSLVLLRAALVGPADRRFAELVTELEAAGEPTSLVQLRSRPLPRAQDGAPLYGKAFAARVPVPAGDEHLRNALEGLALGNAPTPGGPTRVEALAWGRAFCAKQAPARALLDQAVALGGGAARFPIAWEEGFLADLDHLVPMRDLAFDAALVDADLALAEGRPAAAFGHAVVALEASAALSDDPVLISRLVSIAIVDASLVRLERAMVSGARPDRATLERASVRLAALDDDRAIVRVLQGERAFGLDLFVAFDEGRPGWNLSSEMGFPPGFSWAYDRFLMPRDRLEYLEAMTGLIDTVASTEETAVPAAVRERMDEAEKMARLVTRPLSGMILPAIGRVVDRELAMRSRSRTVRTALAASIYQRDHGRWPDSVGALVEAGLLAEPPRSVEDGSPLELAPVAAGGVAVWTESERIIARDDPGAADVRIGGPPIEAPSDEGTADESDQAESEDGSGE